MDVQRCLSGELEEMRVEVSTYGAKISQLMARMQQLITEGLGTSDGLKAKNTELRAYLTTLTDKVLGL